jgi:CPA2 family monovalent cation:H+ antiporter-2
MVVKILRGNSYIIAGMIIGHFTPPFSFILNFDILNLFAEIGVILLLFVVGMEFPIEKLIKIEIHSPKSKKVY